MMRSILIICATIVIVHEGSYGGEVKFWTGLRPMIPDGGPLIGPTRLANLYLNTGHGTLGWTMACGSGRVLADILSGRTPEIPLDGLMIDRFPQGQGI